MFLGHFAVALVAKRTAPSVSLGAWFAAVQLLDLLWPIFLLLGLEHVRVVAGITAFTPLDFYDYPITHSLVGATVWAAVFAGGWLALERRRRDTGASLARAVSFRRTTSFLLAAAVVSHWLLDAASHRPDVPVFPRGPYVGLGLWYSVPATLAAELTMFAAALILYVRGEFPGGRRVSFWLLTAFLLVAYFAAAFGPPPPDVQTLAWSALAMWMLLPWARWADRT